MRANITPMIDVAFLLIVFFVLVSQIVEFETVPMDLPAPNEPASRPASEEQRVVVNVVPAQGGGVENYRLGSRTYATNSEGRAALREHLSGLYSQNPRLRVNLRADRATAYRWIHPVFDAVQQAAGDANADITPRINLVIVREDQM